MSTEIHGMLGDVRAASGPTLARALDELAAVRGTRPAVVGAETLGAGELRARARRVAAGLQRLGVGPGDAVGILGENSVDWITAFFAVMYAGATSVGINVWYTRREIEQVLADANVRVLVVLAGDADHDAMVSLAGALTDPATTSEYVPEHVVVDCEAPPAGTVAWSRLTAASASDLSDPGRAGAPATIIYTSGSTAAPKGVVLDHGSLVRSAASIAGAQGLEPGDRVWSHFPFFFSGGLCNFLLGGLLSGATVVVHPRFEVEAALREVQSGACTAMHCWPNVIRRLVDHPEFDPERTAAVRKGTWPVDLWFGASGFPFLRGVNLYGMTETCTMFTATAPEDPDEIRADTHGRPFPDNEVRIVDEQGRTCEPGVIGEIRLKGPTVMRGYHRQPRAAAFDDAGYLYTHDVGALREDGRLVWHGRSDDMIRTNGINVSPVEVETVLESIEGVRRAGVVGIADATRGERVVALVATDRRGGVDEESLIGEARARLAAYKTPRDLRFVDAHALPTTGSGKIDRRRLRELAAELFDV